MIMSLDRFLSFLGKVSLSNALQQRVAHRGDALSTPFESDSLARHYATIRIHLRIQWMHWVDNKLLLSLTPAIAARNLPPGFFQSVASQGMSLG